MHTNIRPGFVFPWIRSTFLGWTAGFVLVLLLIAAAGLVGLGAVQFPVGLGMGAGVGLLQARMPSFPIPARGRWVAASALGMALPFVAFDAVGLFRAPGEPSLPILVGVGGVLVGAAQWLLLRRWFRRALLWVPSSVVGWSAAGAAAMNNVLLPRIPGLIGALVYVGVLLVGGVLLGVPGGFALRATFVGPASARAQEPQP